VNRTIALLIAGWVGAGTLSCKQPQAAQAPPTSNAAAASAPAAQPPAQPAAAAAPDPAKPMPAQLPDVLARVNGEPVKKTDFDRLILNIELSNGPIPPARRDQVLRTMLDQLITYTAMSQQAKTENIVVSEAEIDERIKQMQRGTSDVEFQRALEARQMTSEQLRSDARVQLTIERLLEAHVGAAAVTTDAEARAFYDKNPDKFKQDDKVRASHILLKVDPKAPETTRQQTRGRIDALLKRARSGEDFAVLAAKHSQDGTARQGGDLGYFARPEMVPAFSQAAFALKPGEISDIVATEYGFHIIKVTDRKPAATVPYEQASEQIVEFLTRQKKQERAGQFVDEVKKRARIEVLV
jgi:peptidyl-prolyl cis-trans isomerase C